MSHGELKTYFLSPEEIEKLYGPVNKKPDPVKKKDPFDRESVRRVLQLKSEVVKKPEKPKKAPKPKIIKNCKIEGCTSGDKGPLRSGYCPMHYARWKRHGDPLAESKRGKPNSNINCTVCGSKAESRGYCFKHYHRFKEFGDPYLKKVQKGFANWVLMDERTGKTVDGKEDVITACVVCGDKVCGRGYCSKHLERIRKYGNPHFIKVNKGPGKPAVLIDERTGKPVEQQ